MTGEPVVSAEEIIAKGEELLDYKVAAHPGDLRAWYVALYEERSERRRRIRIADGTTISLGNRYDFVILNHRNKETRLRGWTASHKALWSDNYVVLTSPPNPEHPYGGRNREVSPSDILSAVEVTD